MVWDIPFAISHQLSCLCPFSSSCTPSFSLIGQHESPFKTQATSTALQYHGVINTTACFRFQNIVAYELLIKIKKNSFSLSKPVQNGRYTCYAEVEGQVFYTASSCCSSVIQTENLAYFSLPFHASSLLFY